jgi:hypothetical protein
VRSDSGFGTIYRPAAHNRLMCDDPVNVLRRWEAAGGLWQIVGRADGHLTVGLFRCDGGEQVDAVHSDDPALRAFVGDRQSSLD